MKGGLAGRCSLNLSWTLNVEHFGKDHSVYQCHCAPDILSCVLSKVYRCSLAHDMYWLRGVGATWLMICTDQGVQVQPGSQHVLTEWCRCLLAHGMYSEGCRYNLTHDMYWGVQVSPSSWRILMKGCRCSLAHDSADWGVRCVLAHDILTEGCRFSLAHDVYRLRGACASWLMICRVQVQPGLIGSSQVTSEDCLMLNVYIPPADENLAPLYPVMVFFHGGGFSMGDAPTYRSPWIEH